MIKEEDVLKKRGVSFDNYMNLLREKDERALDFVIDEYGGLIMSVIRRLLGGFPEEQEECFNDVLMKIWEHSEDYNKELSVKHLSWSKIKIIKGRTIWFRPGFSMGIYIIRFKMRTSTRVIIRIKI